jgi:hypothetical protein
MVMGWQRQWIVSMIPILSLPRSGCFEKRNAHSSSKKQALYFSKNTSFYFFHFNPVVGIKRKNYIHIILIFLTGF